MNAQRKSALIAGIALLVMAVAAVFAFGYAHNSLVIPENPETTFSKLVSSKTLFVTEIIGWVLILLCDIVVSFALFFFFKNENQKLASYTAVARLIYSAILGVSIFYLTQILNLLDETSNIASEIMSKLESFKTYWSFGLIIFGIHLFLLGMLAFKSKFIHNFWGILLIFAGISYSLIHSFYFLLPDFENYIKTIETILSLPMAVAEIGFAFWLIIRGGKPKTKYKSNYKKTLQSS
jgi:hypothetical protein